MFGFFIKIIFRIHNNILSSRENWFCVLKTLFFWCLLLCFPFFIWLATIIDFKKINYLKNYQPSLPSKIFDRNNKEISTLIKENRQLLKYEEIPIIVTQAFVSIEDNNFFEHFGIEPSAILRALLVNFLRGSRLQGGSTITQQLAKIVITSREKTYIRKLKELFFTFYMEYTFSKEEILTMYLNQVYMGHGNYGIQSASRFFLKKDISEISIAGAAILASLTAAPNTNSFLKNPTGSFYRVSRVLLRMLDLGYISLETLFNELSFIIDLYQNRERSSSATAYGHRKDLAPHVTEYIRQKVTKYVSPKLLYSEGLKIYTTIDLEHQLHAQKSLWDALERHDKESLNLKFIDPLEFAKKYSTFSELLSMLYPLNEYKLKESYNLREFQSYAVQEILDELSLFLDLFPIEKKKRKQRLKILGASSAVNYLRKKDVQGAFVELDNFTGGVTVLVGGSPFSVQNQLNRGVNIKRQLGSTFKPFLYSIGLNEQVFHASTLFVDTPLVFLDSKGSAWIPSNYSGGHRGNVLLREALIYSINSISVEIANLITVDTITPVISQAFGISEKRIPQNLTIALGTMSVSPLEVAQAYSIFPRGGNYIKPYIIEKIEDNDGNILYHYKKTQTHPVFKRTTAIIMRTFLEDVIKRGTASFIRRAGFSGIGGGKTGTTQNFRDAWFAGFNKRYTSTVWIGYDNHSDTLGLRKSGGSVAAPIWYTYQQKMSSLLEKDKTILATDDKNLVTHTICVNTGFIMNIQCPERCLEPREEIFDKSNIPSTQDCIENLDLGLPKNTVETIQIQSVKKIEDSIFFSGDDL